VLKKNDLKGSSLFAIKQQSPLKKEALKIYELVY